MRRISLNLFFYILLLFTSAVPKRDPYIEGNKHKYSPGELVELNCTSNSSDPQADLFWYINALPVSKQWLPFYSVIFRIQAEYKHIFSKLHTQGTGHIYNE